MLWTEYEGRMKELARNDRENPKDIGDLLNQGEEEFGEKYAQVLSFFPEKKYQTICNYKSVCLAVPKKVRQPDTRISQMDAVRTLRDKPDLQKRILQRASIMDLGYDEIKISFPEVFGPAPELPQLVTEEGPNTPNLPEDWSGLYSLAIQLLERMLKMARGKQRDAVRLAAEALRDAQNGT